MRLLIYILNTISDILDYGKENVLEFMQNTNKILFLDNDFGLFFYSLIFNRFTIG